MRKLRVKLADDNVYTLQTLTITEYGAVKKLEQLSENKQTRFNELMEKSDDNSLTKKEEVEFEKLQDEQMDNLLKIIVMSIAKAHDEFKINANNDDKTVLDKIKSLMDLRDMKRFATFAMTGTLPLDDEEETEIVETIDLTEND